jgi:hypothetical protein
MKGKIVNINAGTFIVRPVKEFPEVNQLVDSYKDREDIYKSRRRL